MKYRVKTLRDLARNRQPEFDEWETNQGQEILETYGLAPYYSLSDVIRIWKQHSENLCAGWLIHDKEDIERVFCVELEEIS